MSKPKGRVDSEKGKRERVNDDALLVMQKTLVNNTPSDEEVVFWYDTLSECKRISLTTSGNTGDVSK